MRAVLEASQYIDKLENRPAHGRGRVPARSTSTRRRKSSSAACSGEYDYGDGRKEKDPNYMTFFDRNTNFPWKSHGVWWLTQFRRWGMVKEAPDYKGLVDRVHRPDIFREVAKEMGIEVPEEDMKKETFFDGVEFDPAEPEEYAKKFRRPQSWRRGRAMTDEVDLATLVLPLLGYRRRAAHVDDAQPDRGAGSAVAAENLGGEQAVHPGSVFQGRRDEPGIGRFAF